MEKPEIVEALEAILKDKPWDISLRLRTFIEKLRKSYVPQQRTPQQNKALWKYLTLVAEELNASGQDLKKILKPTIDISWNKDLCHDYLWVPVQKALFKTESTADLKKTEQIDAIFDHLNRFLATKGIHIPFPSDDKNEDNYKLDARRGL